MQRSNNAMFEGPRGNFNGRDDLDAWSDESSSVDSCSSGEDWTISTTYIKRPYITTYTALPADAETGYPHIVNRRGTNVVKHRVREIETDGMYTPKLQFNEEFGISGADGVVTFLYNYQPDALMSFLDMKTSCFMFHCETHKSSDLGLDTVIMRDDNRVKVGTIAHESTTTPNLVEKHSTINHEKVEKSWASFLDYEIEKSGRWKLKDKYHDERSGSSNNVEHDLTFDLVYDGARYARNAGLSYSTRREDVEKLKGMIRMRVADDGSDDNTAAT